MSALNPGLGLNAQGDHVKAVQTNLTKVGLTVPALKQPKMGNNIGARSKHAGDGGLSQAVYRDGQAGLPRKCIGSSDSKLNINQLVLKQRWKGN
jgi:hypothetical protein